MGKECVVVDQTSKFSTISEELCIGCGICVNACPFNAIRIINLPNELTAPVIFRYNTNGFQLHRLPSLRQGRVMGLLGVNGIGKSTIVKLLAQKIHPNWGLCGELSPTLEEIVTKFRGSDLQTYFQKLYLDELSVIIKPQMIEYLSSSPQHKNKKVSELLPDPLLQQAYGLKHLADRSLHMLSGGELQRLSVARVCESKKQVYIFDEPTNFLDIRQRLLVAEKIQGLVQDPTKYVLVVDHDLAILDYMSNYMSCLYGKPTAYGVVSLPASVREGINTYLRGFLPAENMRIRDEVLKFVRPMVDEEEEMYQHYSSTAYDYAYTDLKIQQGEFALEIEPGGWNRTDIVLLVGQNGTGKTTFVKALDGLSKRSIVSSSSETPIPEMNISYKPQRINPHFKGTVRQLFHTKIRDMYVNPLFVSDVMKPLMMDDIMDSLVPNLSGGELQRVAITLALGKPADVYLLDEPSSSLDIEMRLSVATSIRRFIKHSRKSCLVVEHDLLMGLFLADRVITYSGTPGVSCVAHTPTDKETGMNQFLKDLNVTIRQDPETLRPRINKPGSNADREQKLGGNYYCVSKSRVKEEVDEEQVECKE